ncbi:unnamed protein product, partial [Closterium sp. NIES-53]
MPRLRSMHSRLLVSRLPRSLPSLPRSPAPLCLPCVEGRQRAAPHSSEFPPTTPPLQTLHMDVWGPALISGTDQERYFLPVVDDYTRYTTVFPLWRKADVSVLRVPSDRGGEFSFSLLVEFYQDEGIRQSFTLPASPHKNGIAERCIGLIMELNLWPRVSLPETLPTLRWTGEVGDSSVFRVWGALSLVRDTTASKLSPRTLRCIFLGFPTDAPPWQFYHPRLRRVFSSQVITFYEFVYPLPPQGPAPSSVSHVDPPPLVEPLEISSDSSGPAEGGDPTADDTAATRRSPRLETPPGFLPRPSSPTPQPAAMYSGVETADVEPGGVEIEGEGSGGVATGGVATGGAGSGGAETGGTASPSGGGAVGDPAGGPRAGQPLQLDLLETLSPQAIRAWIVRQGSLGGGGYGPAGTRAASPGGTRGATGAGGAGPTSPGGTAGAGCARAAGTRGAGGAEAGAVEAGGAAGAGGAGGTGAAGTGGAGGTAEGVGGAVGAGGTGAAGAGGAGGTGDVGARGVGGVGATTAGATTEFPVAGTTPPLLFPKLLPHSPLPAPAPYTAVTESLTERREPETRESSLPDVTDPPSDLAHASSLTVTRLLDTVATDPTFSSLAASALVAELVNFAAAHCLDYLASLVTDPDHACPPSVGGEVALGCDVLEDKQEEVECLAAAAPHLATMLLAPEGDPDAPDIPNPRSYREVISGEYSSQWQTAMDAKMASWKSTGTYVDKVPPPGANIVSGMWIFRGVDYFQTFSPTPKMTTLWVLLHVAAQCDYELHSLDFSTTFLQGSLHEAIWLHCPPVFTGSFPEGNHWNLRRPVYGLRQAPREWHDTLRTTFVALGFAPSTTDTLMFLRTDTTLSQFYFIVYVDDKVFATTDTKALALVNAELHERHTCTNLSELRSYLCLQITLDRARRTITLTQSHMVHQVLLRFGFQYSLPQPTPLSTGHSLSAPPLDESVEPSGPYPKLVGCLMYLMTCSRPDLAYPLSLLARYMAPDRHRNVHFDAAKRVLRYLCSTSGMGLVLGGRGSVVLTGHSDASWADDQATQRSSQGYTFSLGSGSASWRSTRSSSWPCSPPFLYVDNKAMLALCRKQRLEHRVKHIALRYFLARELQQRGQLRLAYVASRANSAGVFTKALGS